MLRPILHRLWQRVSRVKVSDLGRNLSINRRHHSTKPVR
jgi:hypothetical protein